MWWNLAFARCEHRLSIVLTVFTLWLCHFTYICGEIRNDLPDEIRNDLPVRYDNPWNNRLLEQWLQENAGCQKEYEFGYLFEEDCHCVCKSGWRGSECDAKCVDTISERNCRGYKKICNETKYEKWLAAHCPATCDFCDAHGPKSDGFVCGLQCFEMGGVLNETSCQCECYHGWMGKFCQDKCFDLNERCPLWGIGQCNNSIVMRNCPEMCGECEKFGPGSPGFVCTLDCVNGGTLIDTSAECRCDCAPGWDGDQCEEMCSNHFALCDPAPGRGSYNVDMCSEYAFVYAICRKLCGRCSLWVQVPPGFECTLSCQNGGQLIINDNACFCLCTSDWKGIDCSAPCLNVRSDCERIAYACAHPKYAAYMGSKCAKTCGRCTNKGNDFGDHFIAHGETPRSSETMYELRKTGEIPEYGGGIELGILIDVSASTGFGEFNAGVAILKSYLTELDFRAKGGVRVAVVPFSAGSTISVNLFDSVAALDRVIRKLDKMSFEGSRTELDAGLKTMKKKIFVHSRYHSTCVLLIFTDGLFTGEEPFQVADEIRSTGAQIYAISMNDLYIESSLLRLAGRKDHISVLHSISDLPDIY